MTVRYKAYLTRIGKLLTGAMKNIQTYNYEREKLNVEENEGGGAIVTEDRDDEEDTR